MLPADDDGTCLEEATTLVPETFCEHPATELPEDDDAANDGGEIQDYGKLPWEDADWQRLHESVSDEEFMEFLTALEEPHPEPGAKKSRTT